MGVEVLGTRVTVTYSGEYPVKCSLEAGRLEYRRVGGQQGLFMKALDTMCGELKFYYDSNASGIFKAMSLKMWCEINPVVYNQHIKIKIVIANSYMKITVFKALF